MPILDNTPTNLRAFLFHGLDLSWGGRDTQALGTCPFCNKDRKFSVEIETSKWKCLSNCNVAKARGENISFGNSRTFTEAIWGISFDQTQVGDYERLAAERKLLDWKTLFDWQLGKCILNDYWLIPGYDTKEFHVQNVYSYRYLTDKRRWVLLGTPGLEARLFGLNLWDRRKQDVFVCYSDDTEILTVQGWKRFRDLLDTDRVAAYNRNDESVQFEVPKSRQKFAYVGKMFNFKAEWCDLLVTPDHRMIYRYYECRPDVRSASGLGAAIYLPTAGVFKGGRSLVSPITARLLVAFVADGCVRRGFQLEFGLYKDRKKERLKELLRAAGIPFNVVTYPSSAEKNHESVMVDRRDAPRFLNHCPDKTWTGKELDWPLESRQAMLDELQYWDGDAGKNNIRYFTSKLSEAEIVSRVAAISGYSTHSRAGKLNREREVVVHLMKKTWRQLANSPSQQDYVGDVFCVTTSTGFVVVRRNGKVVVSGNCEGPWDAMCLWEQRKKLGDANIVAVPGCTSFPKSAMGLFAGKNVYLAFDNDHPTYNEKLKKEIPAVGLTEMARLARLLSDSEYRPAQIKYLQWAAPTGYNPHLPSGFDVRDALTQEVKL